jgi:hypothetical protein
MTLAERCCSTAPRRQPKARCGASEKQTNRTKREWCPVLIFQPCGRYGDAGEQKHLPDRYRHQSSIATRQKRFTQQRAL